MIFGIVKCPYVCCEWLWCVCHDDLRSAVICIIQRNLCIRAFICTPCLLSIQRCFRTEGEACCGMEVYDTSHYICCNGYLQYKAKHTECCDNKAYDTRKEICCFNGNVFNKTQGDQCCGMTVYNSKTDVCCGTKVQPTYNGNRRKTGTFKHCFKLIITKCHRGGSFTFSAISKYMYWCLYKKEEKKGFSWKGFIATK